MVQFNTDEYIKRVEKTYHLVTEGANRQLSLSRAFCSQGYKMIGEDLRRNSEQLAATAEELKQHFHQFLSEATAAAKDTLSKIAETPSKEEKSGRE